MGPVNERQEEALSKVVDSGKHLLNLINDVLDVSKIESGSLNLFIEENVNLRELVDASVEIVRPMLTDKTVELNVTVDPELPTLKGDRNRIKQILVNVLSNACKFTEKGTVELVARRDGDKIHIAVKDTGVGISPEDHDAVFESFKQTHSGLRQGGGTGLGMPISRSLAEAHGGRLWFESKLAEGSTFYVELPIASVVLTPTLA
jgi:signal transduction histidine kinase